MKFRKVLFACALAFFTLVATACGGKGKEEIIDYVAQAKLSDYYQTAENHNFLDNGIGYATLNNPVDGDTAHFYQKETSLSKERLVKVRFYGIDTPESTGQIEPWGKKASKFTTEHLQNAKSIIITNGDLKVAKAETDSTGSRFKAFVWVADKENAELSEYRCLNLWIVQEGFSNGKGVAGCPLADLFNKADLQAQKLKIHIWAGDDPDFYKGDATVTSIKAIMDEYVANKGSCPTFEGVKVQFTGVVAKVVADDAYVVQDYENEETGQLERYGLFIFAGYKYYEPLTTVGNDLTITGTFTVRYGNPQVTSVSYNPYLPSKDDMVINRSGVEVPYDEMDFKTIDNSYRYVNNVAQFKHVKSDKYGWDAIDKTTQKKSGAMNIRLVDDKGDKMMLRVPANVKVKKKGGKSTDIVDTWEYFSDIGYFDLTAAIAIYMPGSSDDDGGSTTYWQISLCASVDIVYLD